jgi:hypothetical protein
MMIETIVLKTDGGDYVARRIDVIACIERYTKREMIERARGYWPELFKSGDWTYRGLMSLQAYELAIIVNQI